jgi:hypothetical protein
MLKNGRKILISERANVLLFPRSNNNKKTSKKRLDFCFSTFFFFTHTSPRQQNTYSFNPDLNTLYVNFDRLGL